MKTGDTVIHKPSGQRWIVAYVDGDYMSWCGWPDGEALASDCEVVKICSNAEHVALLEEISRAKSGRRSQRAIDALSRMGTS
jgi:uncharacterized protein YodC (DUF2158 family)